MAHQSNYYLDQMETGQVYDVYLEPVGEHRSDAATKAFHAMRDDWAELTGLDKEEAKQILKLRHGVAYDMESFMDGGQIKVPDPREGQFVEYDGEMYYVIATRAMTSDEMAQLLRGVEEELREVT